MDNQDYTARQILEIKTAKLYFILVSTVMGISSTFQIMANIAASEFIPPLIIFILISFFAFIIIKRKQSLKSPGFFPWIVAFLSVNIPIIAKFKYALKGGPEWWTLAAQSVNTSIGLMVFIILLMLHLNKKLYIVSAIYGITWWIIFVYIAYQSGAEFHIDAVKNGVPVTSGIILEREIYFIIISSVIAFLAYKTIPIIDDYDGMTIKQSKIINEKNRLQKELNQEINDKMNSLFEQVDEQNNLVYKFNERMQNQAATFEEVSATLVELLSSAENIYNSSIDQVDGNIKMETIVNEFKNIKDETKSNLDTTYDGISSIVETTNTTNEKLIHVEKTISKIEEQSKKIGETVNLIVDIADRINLLSLNASIEAARAGDAGKGFAVVADEIGKLAFQTSESIKEIESVLSQSSAITKDGVDVIKTTATSIKTLIDSMAESSDKIKVLQESILVEEKYINIIIEQMFNNIELARNIGTGTDEQKRAISSTNEAIDHVNEIVSEMVKEISYLSKTSENILNNAVELLDTSKKAVS